MNQEFLKYCMNFCLDNLDSKEKRISYMKSLDDIKEKLEQKVKSIKEVETNNIIKYEDMPELKYTEEQIMELLNKKVIEKNKIRDKKIKKKNKKKNKKNKKNKK